MVGGPEAVKAVRANFCGVISEAALSARQEGSRRA
jgi:hypothetical protein